MANYLSPLFNEQTFDDNGDPLVGGQIETYEAGTSAPLATYTTQNGVVQHSNPIILDARGEPADPIWLAPSQEYKFVLKTAAGVTIRTIDDVSGVNDVTAAGSEWISSGFTPTYISATSFSVDGDRTGILSPGRRLQTTNTGGTIYSTISTSTFGAGITTVVVRNDSGVLDSGITTVNYGILSPENPSTPNSQAVRQTMGLGYGIDVASAATLPLSTVTGEVVRVTGTVATTAVTMTNGQRIKCIAVAAWPLTYHATNMPIPGSADYTCSPGDMVIFTKNGNGDLTIEISTRDGESVIAPVQINALQTPTFNAGAMTIPAAQFTLDFRDATLNSGVVTRVTATAAAIVIPSTATLGLINAIQSEIALLAIYPSAGTIEYAVVNIAGGVDLSEAGVISTTALSVGSDLSTVVYSTTARANVPYRVLGIYRSTQNTAGTWAQSMTLIQGAGGNAITSLMSLGQGQTWQNVTGSRALGSTYYNPTGKPIAYLVTVTLDGGDNFDMRVAGNQMAIMANASGTANMCGGSVIVPPGQSYGVNTSGGVLLLWYEMR